MRIAPLNFGRIHIIGIGGIGMSGIASILLSHGITVQGSDQSDTKNVKALQAQGVSIFFGHQAENIEGATVVACSSAIQKDNPEVQAAYKKGIPVLSRADLLAEVTRFYATIAISGTHGKTTTTSLVAALLEAGGCDPTVINGGIINSYGTNARIGRSHWLVVEADESDATFSRIPLTIALVTNIEAEHLEYYKSFESLKKHFVQYLKNIPFYGFGMVYGDHPTVQEVLQKVPDRRVYTYGFDPKNHFCIHTVRQESFRTYFDLTITLDEQAPKSMHDFELALMGEHNVCNATAALGVAYLMGFSQEQLRRNLRTFSGVQRRFTILEYMRHIYFIDDYAHHPTEVKAVLKSAQSLNPKNVYVIFQPHRFSRLKSMFAEFGTSFSGCATVLVLPVYAAGEAPILGATHTRLAQEITQKGTRASPVETEDEIIAFLEKHLQEQDIVLFMGAGDITLKARSITQTLREKWQNS